MPIVDWGETKDGNKKTASDVLDMDEGETIEEYVVENTEMHGQEEFRSCLIPRARRPPPPPRPPRTTPSRTTRLTWNLTPSATSPTLHSRRTAPAVPRLRRFDTWRVAPDFQDGNPLGCHSAGLQGAPSRASARAPEPTPSRAQRWAVVHMWVGPGHGGLRQYASCSTSWARRSWTTTLS